MQQIGVVLLDGRTVGVVTLALGDAADTISPDFSDTEPEGSVGETAPGGHGASLHQRTHNATHHGTTASTAHRAAHPTGGHHGGLGHHEAHLADRVHNAVTHGTAAHLADRAHHHTGADAVGEHPDVSGGFLEARKKGARELESNPALKEKMFSLAAGENLDPKANKAVLETMFNRSAVRHTNLETQARRYGKEAGGYYAGWNPNYTAAERKMMESNLHDVLGGSNVSHYATDNSSNQPKNNLAERDVKSGRFQETVEPMAGEHFMRPLGSSAVHRKEWERLKYQSDSDHSMPPSTSTGAKNAPSGSAPEAFIMHHTSGGGTPQGVVSGWRTERPGVGSQYIMDREGRIFDTAKDLGYSGTGNIMPESKYRKNPINGKDFLSNKNVVSMEVIAKNNADVNAKQVAAAKKFMAEHYSHTPVYGHGEVNPGHREADEGMKIVNAINADRSKVASGGSEP